MPYTLRNGKFILELGKRAKLGGALEGPFDCDFWMDAGVALAVAVQRASPDMLVLFAHAENAALNPLVFLFLPGWQWGPGG